MMIQVADLRRWQRILHRTLRKPKALFWVRLLGIGLLGFCLSAASLGNRPQPIAMAALCAGLPGWLPVAYALGAALGYGIFWGSASTQCLAWLAAALPVCLLSGRERLIRRFPMLQIILAGTIVAVAGVLFQIRRLEDTPILAYFLRIGVAMGVTWLAMQLRRRRDTAADWVGLGVLVLGLAQVAIVPFLGLGFVAAGMFCCSLPFPAVAMAGLALDLAQVTPVPMTAVLCLVSLLRMLPKLPKYWQYGAPTAVYLAVMGLCGVWDLLPVPAMILGSLLSGLVPGQQPRVHHRGETGFAQVRLEMAAAVMTHAEQLLLEAEEPPIDCQAIVQKSVDRACGTCPARKDCKELPQEIHPELLLQPLIQLDDVPVYCKKRNRLMLELRRGQDQLRTLQAERQRHGQYRGALMQQYRFVAEFLEDLADQLPTRGVSEKPQFQPEVAFCSSGKELANGDRCLWFAGPGCKYYLLLCDGMGTGPEAAFEARAAGDMLRRLLMAGYPAAYALRSINSLCALRGKAGAVTMDLAQVQLDTGKVMLYKWGAAPSWLLSPNGAERIGRGGPPPGISVGEYPETVDRLSLRHGQLLVLLSDGVDPEVVAQQINQLTDEPPGSLAAKLLEAGRSGGTDDTTAAVLRLMPVRREE